ncbi:hypothetical protein BGZ97_003715, partial [Linnemannia gamsii]
NDDKGDDETEDEELNGEVVADQPIGEGVPAQAQRRARFGTFVGFKDPDLEYVLLQALDTVRPFDAEHGKKASAWEKVVEYLKKYDDKEDRAGRPRVFSIVNARVCRNNWKALSDEYAKHLAKMRQTTGANSTLTQRLQLMGAVYDFEQSYKKEADARKEQGKRKRARIESNRVEGLAMLDRSRQGYRKVPSMAGIPRTPLAVSVPPQQPGESSQSMMPPFSQELQSPRLFSGSGSEATLSAISSISAIRTPRTPRLKKRVMADFANEGIKKATDALLLQGEIQKKQLELLLQNQAERRASEEQRLQREESLRQEQFKREETLRQEQLKREEALRREQTEREKALRTAWKDERREDWEMMQEMLKLQSNTMQEFVKRQTETTERLILSYLQLWGHLSRLRRRTDL